MQFRLTSFKAIQSFLVRMTQTLVFFETPNDTLDVMLGEDTNIVTFNLLKATLWVSYLELVRLEQKFYNLDSFTHFKRTIHTIVMV